MKNFNVIEKIFKKKFLKKFEILCENIPPDVILSLK